MPYAPVKSSPYGPGRRRRRPGHLWPNSWWTKLCDQADRDQLRDLSPRCREMIAEFNRQTSN